MVEPFDNIMNQLKDSPYLDYVKKNPWITTTGVVAAATLAKTGVNLLNKLQQPEQPSGFTSSLFKMFQKPEQSSIGGKVSEIAAPIAALAALGGAAYMVSKQNNALNNIQAAPAPTNSTAASLKGKLPNLVAIQDNTLALPENIQKGLSKGYYVAEQWASSTKEFGKKMWTPISIVSSLATPFVPMPWKMLAIAPWGWNAYSQAKKPTQYIQIK